MGLGSKHLLPITWALNAYWLLAKRTLPGGWLWGWLFLSCIYLGRSLAGKSFLFSKSGAVRRRLASHPHGVCCGRRDFQGPAGIPITSSFTGTQRLQSRMLLLAELYPCQLQADDSWQAGIWLVASCTAPWPYLLLCILLYLSRTHPWMSCDTTLLRRTNIRGKSVCLGFICA